MLCIRKFLVAKKFTDKRWGVSRFCVENVFCHRAEKIGRGILMCCVSENFWWRKSLWIKGGEYQGFASKIFCVTVPKNLVGEPFCAVFQKFSGSEKVYG